MASRCKEAAMSMALHKNATTTPAARRVLQQASGTDRGPAQQGWYRHGHGAQVAPPQHRTRRQPYGTPTADHLNAAQKELLICLCTQLLPLGDPLAEGRKFIEPARAALRWTGCCAGKVTPDLPVQPSTRPDGEHKPFKAYEPGYVHVDVKHLPQIQAEDQHRHVFGHRQSDTLGVCSLPQHKTAASAKAFLAAVRKAAPLKIGSILTDNGTGFTDRLLGRRSRQPTGAHEFDRLRLALGIEHRLAKPGTSQANAMAARFNGRLNQLLRSQHANSAEDLEKTLHRFVWLCNHHRLQKALGHETPVPAFKAWKMRVPD